jgi:hypothetical protein
MTEWSRGRELNSRPADYESAALPLSYLGLSWRPAVFTIASAESFRQFTREIELREGTQHARKVSLARKRIHHPRDAYSDHQKQEKRPKNVLQAVFWAAPAKKPEGDGDHRCKKQKSLKMR